jgi:hypothetical protein
MSFKINHLIRSFKHSKRKILSLKHQPITRLLYKLLIVNCQLFLLLSCQSEKNSIIIILENPTELERTDEAIAIKRSELAGYFNNNLHPYLKNEKGEYIPSQLDDLDQDGKWDELAFVCDLPPNAQVRLSLQFTDKGNIPPTVQRAHA